MNLGKIVYRIQQFGFYLLILISLVTINTSLYSEEQLINQKKCSRLNVCAQLVLNQEEIRVRFYNLNQYMTSASVRLELNDVENLSVSSNHREEFILGIEETKDIGFYKILNREKRWSLKYQFHHIMGDVDQPADRNFIYRLPFEGKSRLTQGYFGEYSHEGKHALDFVMPERTKILAAREGVVVSVEDGYTDGGPSRSYLDKSNYISILHSDGSRAFYGHLVHKGVLVRLGQKVLAGDVIGLSGNTGFSTFPHLHFEVTKPNWSFGTGSDPTIPTYFKTESSPGEFLIQNHTYWHEEIPLREPPVILRENIKLCESVNDRGEGSKCGSKFARNKKIYLLVNVLKPQDRIFDLEVRTEQGVISGNPWTIHSQSDWVYFYSTLQTSEVPGLYRIHIESDDISMDPIEFQVE